jgi:SAM-dependent methyltransferase
MGERTLDYYESGAAELASRYESADLREAHDRIARLLTPGSRLLELGCGSGRDAAALLARGYDVTAVDASAAMLREAVRLHPELAGRLRRLALPAPLPFADASFGGVYAMAFLMHLREPAVVAVLGEAARVLEPAGTLIFSVCTVRPGLTPDGTDAGGRFFNILPDEQWKSLAAAAGFACEETAGNADRLGRDGIRWRTFVARRSG